MKRIILTTTSVVFTLHGRGRDRGFLMSKEENAFRDITQM